MWKMQQERAKVWVYIAKEYNKDFKLSKNISKYGSTTSQEFFAEFFASMESGKPNELDNAIKEYLKRRVL